MASLNQAWNIATGSLAADQAAISVVAGNIANANTPGYTTETVQWGAIDTVSVGGRSSAGGVAFEGAASQRDRILNQRIDQQTQDQSSTAARLAALTDLQSLFSGAITATGNTNSSGLADIGQQMTAFFQSFSSLSADPSNSSLRTGVLSAAQQLAATFNQVSSSLAQQGSGLDASIASAADQVNSLTSAIAGLNAKISASSPTGDAGTLEDQRQYDIQQLSQLIGIHQITNENNNLTITTTSGAVLVAGGQSVDLQTQSSGGVTHLLLGGVDQTSALTNGGGQIGGGLEARDSDIPSALASLDQLAWNVGTAVNAQQASGTDANGNSGAAIFSLGSSATGAANAISVALTNPKGVAASATGAGAQDGSNATAIAALASAGIVGGQTPTASYAALVGEIGTKVSEATTTQASQNASLTQLQSQQSALSSVNMNDQAALLQTFEQSYQAAAKVFTILNSVMTSAINLGTETAVA
ncbi:MAG TPA: flagellar hook-associated protein FlgK [Acidobacteriaceae bacterium]|nr:flagellar hook-associated protein FlgK [Acidobacteriaceae bacterium]